MELEWSNDHDAGCDKLPKYFRSLSGSMDHVWQVWGTIWSLELPPTIHPKYPPYKKWCRSLKYGIHHLTSTVIINKKWWFSTTIFVTFWLRAPHLYLEVHHMAWYEFTTTLCSMMVIFTVGVLNGFNYVASILYMTSIYSQRFPNKWHHSIVITTIMVYPPHPRTCHLPPHTRISQHIQHTTFNAQLS